MRVNKVPQTGRQATISYLHFGNRELIKGENKIKKYLKFLWNLNLFRASTIGKPAVQSTRRVRPGINVI